MEDGARCFAGRIRLELLRIHSKKLEGADTDLCLREAYDVIATALRDDGFIDTPPRDCEQELNDVFFCKLIPALILNGYGEEWFAAVPREQWYEYIMKRVSGRIVYWQTEVLILAEKAEKQEGWSQFDKEWEAKKEVGRLMHGPHERISEAFVRTSLALQNDIKPEEVLWEQILLEVEGISLRSDSPAVELVPTAPATDEDYGPWLFCRRPADMINVYRVHLRAREARHRAVIDEIDRYLLSPDESSPFNQFLERSIAATDQSSVLKELEYISASGQSSPFKELDAAYRLHLRAFLATHCSPSDKSFHEVLDKTRRRAEGLLDECRLTTGSRLAEQTQESASSDGGKRRENSEFASELERDRAVAAYVERWTTDQQACSEASLARTATVDPADLSKWKKGRLPLESDKKARIEKALRNDDPPTLPARRDPEA
jgi:hypothetical protein